MTPAPVAVRIDPNDIDGISRVADVIADAFHPLPPSVWLIPNPTDRARMFPPYFRLFVELAAQHGWVYTSPGGKAVAVWTSCGLAPAPYPVDYLDRITRIVGEHQVARFLQFDQHLERAHPEAGHHHLAFMATRPGHQGAGLLGPLLAHHLAHMDTYGVAGYAEAASPQAAAILGRRGFVPAGNPIQLPPGTVFEASGPTLLPLWRWPTPRTASPG